MIRQLNRHKHPTKIISGFCCLLFLLPYPLPAAAQGKQGENKAAAADKLTAEADRLITEGTKESLEGAIGKLLSAVPLYRTAAAREREADVLNIVGTLYSNLGEPQQALDYFARSLALYREIGHREKQGVALNNIGRVYWDTGETQQALDSYGQALPLFEALKDVIGQATTLNNIGNVFVSVGELPKALDYYEQSLALNQTTAERTGDAIPLASIGNIYYAQGQYQQALKYYERALPLLRAQGDRHSEATALRQIGQVHAASGDLKTAVDYYGQALPLSRKVGDRAGEAATLRLVAAVYRRIGYQKEAVETFRQAVPLYRATGDRSGEAGALFDLAVNVQLLGDPDGALVHIEEALAILDSLRDNIGSQDLRASYFASVQDYYEFYIDLLMQMHKQKPSAGFDGRALQASERARARSLLETLAEAGADIRQGVDPSLLERERTLQQGLNATGQAQVKLQNRRHTDEEAASLTQQLNGLTTSLQQVRAQIRQTSPRYAALTQPQPLSAPEIQHQLLDPDTLLLEYSLGWERSYLWAVTQDSIKTYTLPKGADIEAAARELYALLSDARRWSQTDVKGGPLAKRGLTTPNATQPRNSLAGRKATESATRLSQMLLAPVAGQLGGKRLLIVADGALQFIPFAALPLPSVPGEINSSNVPVAYRPLITEHEIVSLPSASTLSVLRREMTDRKPAAKTIAVLADPVFTRNDVRFAAATTTAAAATTAQNKSPQPNPTRNATAPLRRQEQRGLALMVTKAATNSGVIGAAAGAQIPRLPGTRKEAERILSLVPEGREQMHVFDFAANRAAIADPDLGNYRYLHFATHGFLDSQHPELSGLLLSMYDGQGQAQDGFLRAHEVFNLKLSAELVTLSACQTGLGKEIRGEGLVGLTRGFMYAGAPRVVVSLWSVSDEGTAELMARFYQEMLKEGRRPAAALQAAQISMLKEPKFASPFYWAAFTLQGEWR